MKAIMDYVIHELMGGIMTTQMLTININLQYNTTYTYKQIYNMLSYYEKTHVFPIQKQNTGKYTYWGIKY